MQNLTKTEKRILSMVPKRGFIYLREMVNQVDLSETQVRKLARDLEDKGHLKISDKRHRTDALRISINGESAEVIKKDFDKLLFSIRWMQ